VTLRTDDNMIEIRECNAGDFAGVVALLGQLWPDREVDASRIKHIYEKALVSDSQTYLCATNENRVIGFASFTRKHNLWPDGRLGYVDELVVDSQHQNAGIGSKLLDKLVTVARQKGCFRIELDCAFFREGSGAFAFYEKHGFSRRAFVFSRAL
jgi:ribosomal protein S18 acetylase RimI-like enzyme